MKAALHSGEVVHLLGVTQKAIRPTIKLVSWPSRNARGADIASTRQMI